MAWKKVALDELIEEVRAFMRRVGVREAVLFGSRARNEHVEDSDVDLTLVSEQFRGTPSLGPLCACAIRVEAGEL